MTLPEIESAARRISPYIDRTPLLRSNFLSEYFDASVYLKCENLQRTGSFKVRGALNKLIKTKAKKVTTASMGNHAQGVAYAALRLGAEALVVMPSTVSIVKEEAVRHYGAQVILKGQELAEAIDYSRGLKDHLFIHPYDDKDVIEGQGTIGLEIVEELKDIDEIIVPVGGGGLISGVAQAVKAVSAKTVITGVQSEAALSALISFRDKMPVAKEIVQGTLADGIAVGEVGEMTLREMIEMVDRMESVSEGLIARAIFMLLEMKKLVVEGAGATPLALMLKELPDKAARFKGKKIVLVLSGGNIDPAAAGRIINRALAEAGRLGSFRISIDNSPGVLGRVLDIVARNRANLVEVTHRRDIYRALPATSGTAEGFSLDKAIVDLNIETRGLAHLKEILADIKQEGFIHVES